MQGHPTASGDGFHGFYRAKGQQSTGQSKPQRHPDFFVHCVANRKFSKSQILVGGTFKNDANPYL
jgi:hypothetical protein